MDLVVARCAGLDVSKDEVVACVRTPNGRGGRSQEIRTFSAFTFGLESLADWLSAAAVTEVVMEATGQHWKPVWYLLEQRAFELKLVNARHVKILPGRKIDVADAVWLAELLEHGLLRGRPSSVEDPNGHTTSYTYDPAGNQLSVTDADDGTTSYAYDADDRLVTVTQPGATTLSYSYDPDGDKTSYTDAVGATTTYAYNYLDELGSATDPDAHTTSYAYDADGNQLTMTKPSSDVTTWAYDADGEVSAVSYSDGVTQGVASAYDPDGNVTVMSDASGTSSYAYDPADRLSSYENGAGATVRYGYDADGDVTTLAYPNGQSVTKTYDSLDRLSSVTDWLANTTDFSYDADSDLTGADYPNGVDSSTTYDDADQVASITDTKSATTLASLSYTRDDYGDITAETDTGTPGAGTTGYVYNPLHELTAAGPSGYGYDAAHDLTTNPAGAAQAFDPAGELCWSGTGSGACGSPPGGTTTYSYSSDGNRTTTTPPSGPATSFSWDQANDLAEVTTGDSSASYSYDGNGLRQSETVGDSTTQFTWDVQGPLPLLLSDGANSYIYGPGGTPIEQVSSAGTPSYLLVDQLGSTRALTNSSGAVTATFTYDAWGNLTGSTGSATTPFMYAGQYLDPTTGLYYMQARWYDPSTGEFLSVDPAFNATLDAYGYSDENPLDATDPSGLMLSAGGAGICNTAAACDATKSACSLNPNDCPGIVSATTSTSTTTAKVTTSSALQAKTNQGTGTISLTSTTTRSGTTSIATVTLSSGAATTVTTVATGHTVTVTTTTTTTTPTATATTTPGASSTTGRSSGPGSPPTGTSTSVEVTCANNPNCYSGGYGNFYVEICGYLYVGQICLAATGNGATFLTLGAGLAAPQPAGGSINVGTADYGSVCSILHGGSYSVGAQYYVGGGWAASSSAGGPDVSAGWKGGVGGFYSNGWQLSGGQC
jgi:RHS repeat-associated protein